MISVEFERKNEEGNFMTSRNFKPSVLRSLSIRVALSLALTAVLHSTLWAAQPNSTKPSGEAFSFSHLTVRNNNKGLGSDPWVQFLLSSLNMYSISADLSDQGRPIVPLYTDQIG